MRQRPTRKTRTRDAASSLTLKAMAGWSGAFVATYAVGAALLNAGGVPLGASPLLSGALTAASFTVLLRKRRAPSPGRAHLRAYDRLSRELEGVHDGDELATLLAGTLQRVLRPTHHYLWLPAREKRDFHLAAGSGPDPETPVLLDAWVQEYFRPRLAEAGHPVPAPSGELARWLVGRDIAQCRPILRQGRPIGVLMLGARLDGAAYTEADEWLLGASLRLAGLGLTYLGLQKDERKRRSRLDNLTHLYRDAQKRAITDGLTGLNTHEYFKEQLAKRFSEARRHREPLSIMLVDIDHFKKFNDTFGHPIGDEVLRMVSDAVRNAARTDDTVARYGGEELALVLPLTDLAGAMIVAERVREGIAALEIVDPKERRLPPITVSVGVAQVDPTDANPAEVVDRADQALYAAKRAGRNQVCKAS